MQPGPAGRAGMGLQGWGKPAYSVCLPGSRAGSGRLHGRSVTQRRNESACGAGAVASSLQGVWGAASTAPWPALPLLTFKPANSPGP